HRLYSLRRQLSDRADDQTAERNADEMRALDVKMIQNLEHVATDGFERVALTIAVIGDERRLAVPAQIDEQHVELLCVGAQLTKPYRRAAACAVHQHDPVEILVEYVRPVVQHP